MNARLNPASFNDVANLLQLFIDSENPQKAEPEAPASAIDLAPLSPAASKVGLNAIEQVVLDFEVQTLLSRKARPQAEPALDPFDEAVDKIEQLLASAKPQTEERYPAALFAKASHEPITVDPNDAPLCIKKAIMFRPLTFREKLTEGFFEMVPFFRF
ncbi:MAG TPA: hypothetical protein VHP58_02155 [Alphaproteobacteria bacterium]|nr:hypothetical protein [Alphaproteobacteria bacterium]